MIVGGALLLVSGLMLVWNLMKTHATEQESSEMEYAEPIHAAPRVPHLLNSFAFWNVVIAIYIVASYGYPIAQFFLNTTYGATPWGV